VTAVGKEANSSTIKDHTWVNWFVDKGQSNGAAKQVEGQRIKFSLNLGWGRVGRVRDRKEKGKNQMLYQHQKFQKKRIISMVR